MIKMKILSEIVEKYKTNFLIHTDTCDIGRRFLRSWRKHQGWRERIESNEGIAETHLQHINFVRTCVFIKLLKPQYYFQNPMKLKETRQVRQLFFLLFRASLFFAALLRSRIFGTCNDVVCKLCSVVTLS